MVKYDINTRKCDLNLQLNVYFGMSRGCLIRIAALLKYFTQFKVLSIQIHITLNF